MTALSTKEFSGSIAVVTQRQTLIQVCILIPRVIILLSDFYFILISQSLFDEYTT